MPRHQDHFIGFDYPRLWEDRSIIAFSAPGEEKREGAANLVVTRDAPQDHENLDDYVKRQEVALSHDRDGYERIDKQKLELDGRPAWSLSFRSLGGGTHLDQRLVFTRLDDGQMLCLTMTAPRADAAQMAPLFDHIVRSITFPSEGGNSR